MPGLKKWGIPIIYGLGTVKAPGKAIFSSQHQGSELMLSPSFPPPFLGSSLFPYQMGWTTSWKRDLKAEHTGRTQDSKFLASTQGPCFVFLESTGNTKGNKSEGKMQAGQRTELARKWIQATPSFAPWERRRASAEACFSLNRCQKRSEINAALTLFCIFKKTSLKKLPKYMCVHSTFSC